MLRLKLENNSINNFISPSILGYIEILAYMDLLLLPIDIITVVIYMHLYLFLIICSGGTFLTSFTCNRIAQRLKCLEDYYKD